MTSGEADRALSFLPFGGEGRTELIIGGATELYLTQSIPRYGAAVPKRYQ